MLAARLDPFHRAVQSHGQEGQHELLGIDLLLDAEPAADVRSDHADPMFRQMEHVSHHVAQSVRPLRGRPQRQVAGAGIVARRDAPGFERHPGVAVDVVGLAGDHVGLAKGRVRIADSHREVGGDVVAQRFVQQHGARRDGRPSVRYGLERLVLDLDELRPFRQLLLLLRLGRQLVGTILPRGGGRWRTRLRLSLGRLDDLIQQFRGGGRHLCFVAVGSLGFRSRAEICVGLVFCGQGRFHCWPRMRSASFLRRCRSCLRRDTRSRRR